MSGFGLASRDVTAERHRRRSNVVMKDELMYVLVSDALEIVFDDGRDDAPTDPTATAQADLTRERFFARRYLTVWSIVPSAAVKR